MQISFDNVDGLDIKSGAATTAEKYLIVKKGNSSKLCWVDPKIYLTGPNNYETVGSPTITDGIASGFINAQNYLRAPNFTVENFADCEFLWKHNNNGTSLPVFSVGTNQGLWILVLPTSKILRVKIGNSTYYDFSLPASYTSTDYFYYNLKFKDYKCSFYFGSDINSMSLVAEHQFNTPTNLTYTNVLRIGSENNTWSSGTVWNGLIDMKETSVNVNNSLWFYGKNYASAHIAPVPSGFTYGTTTTSSIGFVDMRTQQFTAAPSGTTIGQDS